MGCGKITTLEALPHVAGQPQLCDRRQDPGVDLNPQTPVNTVFIFEDRAECAVAAALLNDNRLPRPQ
jgi:hypothetical protein